MSAHISYAHLDMEVASNNPGWLPFIGSASFDSYFGVVSSAAVVYDWALTFAQELELVWVQRWSFMTVLYICARYIGILYSAITILWYLPISITNMNCTILYFIRAWIPVVVNAMLGVIIMIRIYAMYQRSTKMLVFLVVALLASTIASSILTVMENVGILVEEFTLSGYRECTFITEPDQMDMGFERFISFAIWEILAFILAVWIVIKHFRELRQSRTGSTTVDSFRVLTKSHAFYFVAFAVVSCLSLGFLSPHVMFSTSVGSLLYSSILQIIQMFQMFVLGPRLFLSIREYHAELVAKSDEGTYMTSIHFQASDRDVLTGGDI